MPFQILRNDITKVEADAIVNSANPEPIYAQGTDAAVYRAAGADQLLAERKKIGRIAPGEAVSTPAFALAAKYIIHTVGPVWDGGGNGELETLASCYRNSLALAKKLGCESIAFPLISTGVYGFPKAEALQTAVSVFSDFLMKEDMQIFLVVFDREAFVLSGKIFSGIRSYIDENYVDEYHGAYYDAGYRESVYRERRLNRTFGQPMPSRAPMPPEASRTGGIFHRKKGKPVKHAEPPVEKSVPIPEFDAPDEAQEFLEKHEAASYGSAPVSRSLDDAISEISETWQQSLLRMIDERGYTDVEVYKRANIDKKLFSKIRSNKDYHPKKSTAVALALSLGLNMDETKDFLSRAGYALSPCSKFDLIIRYFIDRGVYDMYAINLALFEHEQPILGE